MCAPYANSPATTHHSDSGNRDYLFNMRFLVSSTFNQFRFQLSPTALPFFCCSLFYSTPPHATIHSRFLFILNSWILYSFGTFCSFIILLTTCVNRTKHHPCVYSNKIFSAIFIVWSDMKILWLHFNFSPPAEFPPTINSNRLNCFSKKIELHPVLILGRRFSFLSWVGATNASKSKSTKAT